MLESLSRRPRGRSLAPVLNRLSRGRIPAPPAPVAPAAADSSEAVEKHVSWFDPDAREIGPKPSAAGEVTRRLHGLLDEGDLAEMRDRLTAEDARQLQEAHPAQRPLIELVFCVHYGVESALDKTGLSRVVPPEDVHAMGRGALAAGGSSYYADLVVEGLRAAGSQPSADARMLDFGCSSGRVVRVLAAAYPKTEWFGCDPNESAIHWARENLPKVAFDVSPTRPPLRYEHAYFDAIFAISIWTHFSEAAALSWLEEMTRIARPGGRLLLTAQGYQSIAHYGRAGLYSPEELERAAGNLYARGFWFIADVFGETGDHGLRDDDWGMTFLTPEWILMKACPTWALVAFEPGRAEENHDLYVLERR
jgi:SAM-dependent methyltransferase